MSSKPLPDGWRIVSLHREDEPPTIIPKGGRVSDADIESSDAIRVSYTNRSTGVTSYRTIHGADSKAQIGDLIRTVVRVVSPT